MGIKEREGKKKRGKKSQVEREEKKKRGKKSPVEKQIVKSGTHLF
jgi:hypothetical protein